jgi:hypothetical protein
MSQPTPFTARRAKISFLVEDDVVRISQQAEDVDAAFGETLDLLPLHSLVKLTERSRAA